MVHVKSYLVQRDENIIFADLFENKENVLNLFEELCPEYSDSDLSEDDIDIIDISNSSVSTYYEDLAFSVKNKVLVVCEAQNAFKENDILRLSLYAFQTLMNYVTKQGIGTPLSIKKMVLPEIKVFMLYTGDREGVKSTYSLRSIFFDNNSEMPDITVHVLFPNFDKIGDIGNQFMLFCKEEVDLIKEKNYDLKIEEIIAFIDSCIERGILPQFLEKYRQEVIGIIGSDVFYERELNKREKIGIKKGLAEARAEGEIEGIFIALRACNVDREKAEEIFEEFKLSPSEIESITKRLYDTAQN